MINNYEIMNMHVLIIIISQGYDSAEQNTWENKQNNSRKEISGLLSIVIMWQWRRERQGSDRYDKAIIN